MSTVATRRNDADSNDEDNPGSDKLVSDPTNEGGMTGEGVEEE